MIFFRGRFFTTGLITVLWMTSVATTTESDAAERQPNVIVFLSDDQGWGDFSGNGNQDLATPHLDELASQGASFNNFYVCPVCSPTRAEYLTGRYHPRGNVFATSAGGERLDLDESTIAESFRSAGYATALFGKWHNGAQPPYHPNARGFDEFYGFCCGHWGHYFSPTLEHNGTRLKGNGFVADDFTDHAIDFISNHRDQSFFVTVAFNTPHSPMQVPTKYWQRFENKPITQASSNPPGEQLDHTRAALAMCENLDDNVGRVMQKLDELKISKQTIVVYFCDNGPNGWRYNGGLKGSKGSTDEGGIRSPLFIRWPEKIRPGTVIPTLAGAIDLRPTLLGLCGITESPNKPLDGINLQSELLNQTVDRTSRLLFSHWRNRVSVRSDQYRLDHTGELFAMSTDRNQQQPVNQQHPEIAEQLQSAVATWRETVLAELDTTPQPFTVGHPDFSFTPLPAGDGTASGSLKRSNQFPNSSFWTNWIDTSDTISWPVNVLTPGRYDVGLYHTIREIDLGAEMQLEFQPTHGNPSISISQPIDVAHDPPLIGTADDRFERVESYEKDFRQISMGEIELPAGTGELILRAKKIPGERAVDFRLLMLKRASVR